MSDTKASKIIKDYFLSTYNVEVGVTTLKRDTPVRYKADEDFCLKVELKSPDAFFEQNIISAAIKNKDEDLCKKITMKLVVLPFSLWEYLFENSFVLVKEITSAVGKIDELKKVGTKKEKAVDNFTTIQNLVKEKGFYDGTPNSLFKYTKEDIAILRNYEGRGGLKLLGNDGSTGSLNEFYTPEKIATMMYKIAIANGFTTGKILEPSIGIGRLVAPFIPSLLNGAYQGKKIEIVGYEKDKNSATICALLYPEITVIPKEFESQFYTGNIHTPKRFIADYDLVVGNPPYEETKGYYIAEYKEVGATQYDQYFISRGLDLLKPGGLLIMIVPSTFLRNERSYNAIKNKINAKADLLQAFRLPNDVFPNTGVGTDILCFKKLKVEN